MKKLNVMIEIMKISDLQRQNHTNNLNYTITSDRYYCKQQLRILQLIA